MPFTGTPDEIRLKGLLNDLFIQNELGGASPYVLSSAKAGKSGYSFGVPQFDLSSNSDGRDLLKTILENATISGNYIVDDGNPATGRSNDSEVLRLYSLAVQPGGISLNPSDKAKINQAVGSSYGVQAIDAALDPHLKGLLDTANAVINLTAGLDRTFLESDLGKLFLSDFDNQYSIELPNPPTSQGGALARFVQGQTVFGITKQGDLGVGDLLNFYFRTQQARQTPYDPIRRFANVVEVAGWYAPDNTPTDLADAKEVLQAYTFFVVPNKAQITSANAGALAEFMALVINPAKAPVIAAFAAGHTIDGEVLVGTEFSNVLDEYGSLDLTKNDLLFGEGGNDFVYGHGGDDVLYGGDGADTLQGDAGNDHLFGGDEDDTLRGGADDDTLEGGAENDTLIGGAGTDLLKGGAGFDTYLYNLGDGPDTIEDSDSNGAVKFNGTVLVGGYHRANDPAEVYRSADGTITFTKAGNDLVITGSGSLTIKNFDFTNGMLGITLSDAPSITTEAPSTVLTISGDFEPLDTDLTEEGVQIGYDELGNIIQDPESPADRSDIFNGSGNNDTINGGAMADRLTALGGSDVLVGLREAQQGRVRARDVTHRARRVV